MKERMNEAIDEFYDRRKMHGINEQSSSRVKIPTRPIKPCRRKELRGDRNGVRGGRGGCLGGTGVRVGGSGGVMNLYKSVKSPLAKMP